jgi:dCMP deaminase
MKDQASDKSGGAEQDLHFGAVSATVERTAKWDYRFMRLAQYLGTWSKDRSRRVGCVIIGPENDIRSTGYNGFPRDIDDSVEHRYERPLKYMWTEHAERNAIYNAARLGTPVGGCRMYLPWYPCIDCARAIVQCRISELIAIEPDWNDPQWKDHFGVTRQLFSETELIVRFLDPKRLRDDE